MEDRRLRGYEARRVRRGEGSVLLVATQMKGTHLIFAIDFPDFSHSVNQRMQPQACVIRVCEVGEDNGGKYEKCGAGCRGGPALTPGSARPEKTLFSPIN
jgi:hypothetical protein